MLLFRLLERSDLAEGHGIQGRGEIERATTFNVDGVVRTCRGALRRDPSDEAGLSAAVHPEDNADASELALEARKHVAAGGDLKFVRDHP